MPKEIKTQMNLFASCTQENPQEWYYLGFVDAVN